MERVKGNSQAKKKIIKINKVNFTRAKVSTCNG